MISIKTSTQKETRRTHKFIYRDNRSRVCVLWIYERSYIDRQIVSVRNQDHWLIINSTVLSATVPTHRGIGAWGFGSDKTLLPLCGKLGTTVSQHISHPNTKSKINTSENPNLKPQASSYRIIGNIECAEWASNLWVSYLFLGRISLF